MSRHLPALVLACTTVGALAVEDVAPIPADAEATLVVTATKQAEEVHRLPLSVDAFDADTASEAGDLRQLWARSPNVVQFADRPNGNLTIRGIGTGEQPRFGGEENPTRGQLSPVGFYVDGVPMESARGLSVFDSLFDVERVEVLKGPQGTLYGRNALGGVVNVRSRDPGDEWNAHGMLYGGSYGEARLGVASGGPLTDTLGVRLAVEGGRGDGAVTNRTTDDDQADESAELRGRGKVAWQASDDLSVRLTGSVVRREGNIDYWVPYEDREERETTANHSGEEILAGHSLGVETALRVAPDTELTVAAGYGRADSDVAYDADRSANEVAEVEGFNHTRTLSIETRLAHGGDDALTWLVGAFAQSERIAYDTQTRFTDFDFGIGPYYELIGQPEFQDKDSVGDGRSLALFGEGTYDLDARWSLTAGLRVGYEDQDFDWSQVRQSTSPTGINDSAELSDSRDEAVVLPKGVITYHIDADALAYASVTRGYRAGGFNVNGSSATSAAIEYDAEFTWNYETGLRSLWRDRTIGVDLTGFYTDWRDQQVFTNVSAFDVARVNAARSHVLGAELEVTLRPLAGLEVYASGGVLESEYDEREDQFSGFDYEGNRFAHVPRYTWAVGGGYHHASGVFGGLDVHGQGSAYVDDANTGEADSFALLDARLGYAAGWWSLALVGRNLTDETYIHNSITLPADFIFSTTDTTYVRLGSPRTVGLEASAWW